MRMLCKKCVRIICFAFYANYNNNHSNSNNHKHNHIYSNNIKNKNKNNINYIINPVRRPAAGALGDFHRYIFLFFFLGLWVLRMVRMGVERLRAADDRPYGF